MRPLFHKLGAFFDPKSQKILKKPVKSLDMTVLPEYNHKQFTLRTKANCESAYTEVESLSVQKTARPGVFWW